MKLGTSFNLRIRVEEAVWRTALLSISPASAGSIENRQLLHGHLLNCLLSASPCIWYEEPI